MSKIPDTDYAKFIGKQKSTSYLSLLGPQRFV